MTTLQRRVIQTGALAVIAVACYAEFWYPSRTWSSVLVDIVPGSSFVLAGLIAWSLRPRNHVGLLMIGVGVGLMTRTAAFQDGVGFITPPAQVVLHFLSPLWAVAFLQLLLAFPSGRLVSRLDRAVVRSFYVVVPLAAVLAVVVLGYDPRGPIGQPVFEIKGPADFVYLACLVIGSGLVIRRWFLGGRARRRSMSPLFWPMVPITIFFLLSGASFLGARIAPIPVVGLKTFLDAMATASRCSSWPFQLDSWSVC